MAKTKKVATPEEVLQESEYLATVAPFQIPQNWCWTSLGKVCHLNKGESIENTLLPYWDAKSLRGTKEAEIVDSGCIVEAGEKVILVDGENSGEVFSIPSKGYMGSTFKVLDVCKSVNSIYVQYFIDSYREKLRNNKVGSAIPHLNKELFFDLSIPLPPLAEQNRIVEKVGSMFQKLDEAKELIQQSIDNFADRRAAILHKAFSGELTEGWRIHNAKECPWIAQTIGECCIVGSGGTPSRKHPEYFDGNIPWVKTGEIEWNIIDSSEEHISKEAIENSSAKIYKAGSVVVAMYGMGVTRGKAGILGIDATTNQAVCVLNPRKTSSLNNRFLMYYFMCNYWNIREMSVGGNQLNLSAAIIKNLIISIPLIEEQNEIVRILDNFFEKEDKTKELLDMLDRIDEMKKAILSRAFRGELGTNDPADEPAVELLKKVLNEE